MSEWLVVLCARCSYNGLYTPYCVRVKKTSSESMEYLSDLVASGSEFDCRCSEKGDYVQSCEQKIYIWNKVNHYSAQVFFYVAVILFQFNVRFIGLIRSDRPLWWAHRNVRELILADQLADLAPPYWHLVANSGTNFCKASWERNCFLFTSLT